MAETPTIDTLIPKLMGEVRSIAKDHRNKEFNYNFRSIDDVLNAISPALQKVGVSLGVRILSVTREAYASSRGTSMSRVTTHLAVDFYGPAGDVRSIEGSGEAADAQDKAAMKSMVQAFKYAVLLGLAIPTDDPDPDSMNPPGQASEQGQEVLSDDTAHVSWVQWAKQQVLQLVESSDEAARVWSEAVGVAEADTGTREEPKPITGHEAKRVVEAARVLARAAKTE